MVRYYELMCIIWKDGRKDNQFRNESEIATAALNEEMDTESETVATAIGIIRLLLKNDVSVKRKYNLKRNIK